MKKVLRNIGRAFSAFFVSLWDDFVTALRKHWLKLLGYVAMFIVPVVYLFTVYLYKAPERWTLPTFAWLPYIVFALVYWFKLRSYLAVKVSAMETENNIQKGKHAGAIIILKTLQMAMTVTPFLLLYFLFDELSRVAIQVRDVFFFLTICESVGGLLVVMDTIANVIDYSEDNENGK